MKRCPSERALLKAYAGSGDDALRSHLHACAACAERFAAVERDAARLARVLLEPRPRGVAAPARRAPRWLWAPAAAAAAAAGALALQLLAAPPPAVDAPSDAEVRAAVRDVSSALFLVGEPDGARVLPSRPSPTAIVQAALAGGWPAGSAAGGPER